MVNNIFNTDSVKGLLIDINGTLYFKNEIIPGAVQAVERLNDLGLKLLFLTNTDSKTPTQVWKVLKNFNFPIERDQIFTPIIALKRFLSQNLDKKSYFIMTKEVRKEFKGFPEIQPSETPDFVVIGDFRDDWDVHRLNQAFNYVLKGSKLLGTQGNKFFLNSKGDPVLDTGSFVSMIAKAANVKPKIFGKPSKSYFQLALNKLDLKNNEVLVIGDDMDSDIKGALNLGIDAILVKTGKGLNLSESGLPKENFTTMDSFSHILNLFI